MTRGDNNLMPKGQDDNVLLKFPDHHASATDTNYLGHQASAAETNWYAVCSTNTIAKPAICKNRKSHSKPISIVSTLPQNLQFLKTNAKHKYRTYY